MATACTSTNSQPLASLPHVSPVYRCPNWIIPGPGLAGSVPFCNLLLGGYPSPLWRNWHLQIKDGARKPAHCDPFRHVLALLTAYPKCRATCLKLRPIFSFTCALAFLQHLSQQKHRLLCYKLTPRLGPQKSGNLRPHQRTLSVYEAHPNHSSPPAPILSYD